MTSRAARIVIPLLSLVFAVACGGTPSGSPAATLPPGATPGPTDPPTGRVVAVVRIEQTGGMIPPWEQMRWYPSVALYEDGRLITQGPQIEIYPGPALPNLQVTRLTQNGVAQVLVWAQEAGLAGPDRALGEPILDSGVTLFTIVSADGAVHHTSVTDMSGGDPAIGALRQFQDLMLNLRAWLAEDIVGADEPYAFDRLRVIAFPADLHGVPEPNLSATLDWPLGPIATLGQSWGEPSDYRCFEVTGEDLDTLRPLLDQANELTAWRSDDELFLLYLHPLLPDDEACPGLP